MRSLEQLNFDNSYARLPPAFYTRLAPTPLANPYLVSFNEDAARLIDLDPRQAGRPELCAALAGNWIPPGADPIAMLYSGHQFGHYVPQLGDGRAILLGEIVNAAGERWTMHLKGAGQTPYSRTADGRAVLRSTIREYLCSEAMHALGIPTTRALAVVGADEPVYRESVETAAVLTRLAPSHVRFGSFEVFYYRRQVDELRTLADYVIAHHFAELEHAPDKYARFLGEVAQRTARLIASWQAVGFAHGVMNTDNMSVLGLTFDYGPFGFMEGFDPGFICNHSDDLGRYSFERQPDIGLWNLTCLAQALTPLIPVEECRAALAQYEPAYVERYAGLMRAKFGFASARDEDRELITGALGLLAADRVDYTLFFRRLADLAADPEHPATALRAMFTDTAALDAWARRYRQRLALDAGADSERRQRMNRINPKYVLRNYLAQVAIQRAQERDYSEVERLARLLRRPFDEQPELESYAAPPPDWARHIEVSCSS